MLNHPWIFGPALFVLGLAIGCFGTMIGAGGGFILVPILLFLYPHESPQVITAISLAVVFFNALSGSIAYFRKGRVDIRSAIAFSLISLPGAMLGVTFTHLVTRQVFEPLFGGGLILVGLWLMFRKAVHEGHVGRLTTQRQLTDRDGHTYTYGFDMRIGLALSAVVGFVSSFLGIGGGIIHVPALVHLLGFPVHVATATSHCILAAMALVATLQHGWAGSLTPGLSRLVFLAPGVVIGAPLGARLSQKVRGAWILRALAGALVLVGVRLLL